MLPNWKNRSEITANLFNPAFCSYILTACLDGYKAQSTYNFPFSLSFLVLPLILKSHIRDRLPKNKNNSIHRWINENDDLKMDLYLHITAFVPFTKEALSFALIHKLISIDDEGKISVEHKKNKFKSNDEEIKTCLKKAEMIGKILSRSGSPQTIFSILGIQP